MQATSKDQSLQSFIDSKPDLVEHFFNTTTSPHVSGRVVAVPIPAEWSNWREEQRAWRETAILFDQSHHMPEMFLSGPDAQKLLSRIGVNSLANIAPNKARQFVGCNPAGEMIGECILYCHSPTEFELVSGMHFQNWIHYQAVAGRYDVKLTRDLATADNPGERIKFRFGIDGPNAEKIFADVVEGEVPSIPFFNTARVKIAGCDVLALRHGMAGHKGVELSGAYRDGPAVVAALLAAGSRHGLRRGGTTAYFSASAESGWAGYPVPAVYTHEALHPYREWLTAASWETRVQLGGSFRSKRIEDYYVTPYDMGYDRLVKFDHDFIGRDALEAMSENPRRTGVSLLWNKDDLGRLFQSNFEPGLGTKALNLPVVHYSFQQYDEVRLNDNLVGLATRTLYSDNEREIISLAMIDRAYARVGTEVTLIWGEAEGGSRKLNVERHRQTEVRATVAPKPYASAVRRLKTETLA